MGKIFVLFINC